MDSSYIFCNYEATFPPILHHFQHTSAKLCKTLYNSVVKFPVSTSEHVTKTSFQFVICKMSSYVVHPLEGQTGRSLRVSDLAFQQDG
jgi:hypothetical protein